MATIVLCQNQLIRPRIKVPAWMQTPGWGDCTACLPNGHNHECKGYVPVRLRTFEMKGGDPYEETLVEAEVTNSD